MVTRREVLRTGVCAGVAGLGGIATTGGSAGQAATGSFVQTDGADLVIDGDVAYFHGANNFWITDSYRGTQSRIDSLFSTFDEMGINLVRTFVACEGGDGDCYIPSAYTHDEGAFETLDYLIAAAAEHDVRLVLVLADNWDHNGGVAKYVEWTDGASEHGDFFVDGDVKDLYRWHVEGVLTRQNTVTGVEYRNDPTIAMWELCNEPRIEGDDTTTIDDRGAALEGWVAEMSAFVKDLDPDHLISTGTEGFYTREDRTEWFYDDWTGQDYVRLHSVDDVDVCTFHWYPYHWNVPLEYGSTWIREHVEDAHEVIGKPAYMGEFNVNRTHGLATRNEVLADWYATADAYDCNAATIWQIVLPEMHDHDGFQVYRSESGDVLGTYRDAVVAKSEAELITDGQRPGLQAPTSVAATSTAETVEVDWASVAAAAEYAVTLNGGDERTTADSGVTVEGLSPANDYEVAVTALGPDGSASGAATTTVATVDGSTLEHPIWERGTVYESGDRVVWNGVVWEANWYTDQEEPRFESGYAWSFVRQVAPADGTLEDGTGPGTPEPGTPEPGTPEPGTPEPGTPEPGTPEPGTPEPGTPEPGTPEPPTGTPPTWPDGTQPGDPNDDGVFEDLNGNERVDSDDVVVYFEHYDEPYMADDASFYDLNDNGRTDADDVVSLFESL